MIAGVGHCSFRDGGKTDDAGFGDMLDGVSGGFALGGPRCSGRGDVVLGGFLGGWQGHVLDPWEELDPGGYKL